MSAASAIPNSTAIERRVSVDAYRGFVMFLMMAEVLRFYAMAKAYPGNWFWSLLAFHETHVEWAGCSLHDMIQPSFSFLVGVALPYSIASRMRSEQTFAVMFGHALWRAVLLILLGFFLRSLNSTQTNFTFEDTLTQIGLGYPLLFLLGFRSARWQWSALALILSGYWLAWALYPLPGADFNYAAVAVPPHWQYNFTGFAAHWNKNSNVGSVFDQWFLNLFPRASRFIDNDGGYLTLSFIPTLGTMILGLVAGRWLKSLDRMASMKRFLIAGSIAMTAGFLFHVSGICPIVKRIWTPSWVLFSGGVCFLFLAAFCWVIDIKGYRRWAFPLVVIGMNSIAAYLIAHLFGDFITRSFRTHLGAGAFQVLGSANEPLLLGVAVLLTYWLMLYWMYRRKVFLKL